MTDRAPQNQDKFIVRLPDGMRDRIKAAAERNGRSMNSEIVSTLEEKYPEPFARLTAERMLEITEYLRTETDLEKARSWITEVNKELRKSGFEIRWTETRGAPPHDDFYYFHPL
jgi:hypothetical protein